MGLPNENSTGPQLLVVSIIGFPNSRPEAVKDI